MKDEVDISDLTKMQRKAVNSDGPLTVFAGAGTGKTTTVVNRVNKLVSDGESPEDILVTTFTNDAADELSERIDADVKVDTVHGLFYSDLILDNLNEVGFGDDVTILNEDSEKERLVEKAMKSEMDNFDEIDRDVVGDTVEVFVEKLDEVRDSLKSAELEDLVESGRLSFPKKIRGEDKKLVNNASGLFYSVYRSYNDLLREENRIDFTGILFFTHYLLKKDDSIRQTFKKKYSHIYVDEAQDLNRLQYEIFKLISEKDTDIWLIGDDCQNIYTWRAANHELMKEFESEYLASRIKITTNFRSSEQILSAANKVNNSLKDGVVNKKLKSFNGFLDESVNHPRLRKFETAYDEEDWVSRKISVMVKHEDIEPSEIAVISRSVRSLKPIYNNLVEKGVPVYNDRGNQLLEKREVRYILDFLKVFINRDSDVTVENTLERYVSGIGSTTLDALNEEKGDSSLFDFVKNIDDRNDVSGVGRKYARNLRQFASFIESLDSRDNPIESIIDSKNFKTNIESYCGVDNVDEDRLENIGLIKSKLCEREFSAEGVSKFFDDVINEISSSGVHDSVRLTTVHGAKGKEWKVVFIPKMVEGVFPSYYTTTKEEFEEEKRLFYVGITRSKEKCWLTYHTESKNNQERNRSNLLELIE